MVLSQEQELAVLTSAPLVLVAASAGSGKTTVIVERIRYLLNWGVEPQDIYAITYTNMAAQEMLERIGNENIFIGTIHSLANRILLSNNIETSQIIEEQKFSKLLQYVAKKKIDLPKIEHLLIDEFQDVSDEENIFIRTTLNPSNLFIVGDSSQSIYGFKGGNYEHFMNLVEDEKTKIYNLTLNYRNGKNILNFANKFLDNIYDIYKVKSISKTIDSGYVETETYSLPLIYELLSKKNYKDWFILCRSNKQVEDIMFYLKKRNVPCSTFKKSEKTFLELNEELKENTVKVLTVHSAKGLEADNVIVIGTNSRSDEEKRVCYVACTRARKRLIYMYFPKKKNNKKYYDAREPQVIDFYQAKNKVQSEILFEELDKRGREKFFECDDEFLEDEFLPTRESINQLYKKIYQKGVLNEI